MKVIIPFTGGINSTYAIWRWLTETDHEIVSRYGYDTWLSQSATDLEMARINKSLEWLRANCRDFDFQIREFSDEYQQDLQPIRAGFTKGKWDKGKVRRRYEAAAQWVAEENADAVVIGMSMENTSHDCGYNQLRVELEQPGVSVYLSGFGLVPVPTGSDFDWEQISTQLTGRYEQFDALPTPLKTICRQCTTHACDTNVCDDLSCLACAYTRGYEKFITDGKTGREFDLYCAEKGSYGPWRSAADPAEYMYRGGCCDECSLWNYLADAAGLEWPIVIHTRNRIQWLSENGADMTGIETEEQLGDFCGRMGRINLDRGVNSDGMTGDDYWSAILAAERLNNA
jgi:hypothetical protein